MEQFFLQPKDRAQINHGQFKGYEVEVTALDEDSSTVHVSMEVFGRPVPLTFSFAQAVELLGPLPSSRAAESPLDT